MEIRNQNPGETLLSGYAADYNEWAPIKIILFI